MPNYLVTGGAGFIGSHLVHHLVEQGEAVRVLDSFLTGSRENLAGVVDRIELIEGDVRDADACARAVEDMDYVLHQAALPSVPRSIDRPVESSEINALGTARLLDAARTAGVRRFVYAASSSAYGDREAPAKRESHLAMPLSPYAAAKLAGEYFCQAFTRSFGLETVSIRYFNVFGPRQDPDSPYSAVIPLFIKAMLRGGRPTIHGDGKQSRDFTYVDNVVRGNVLAATTAKPVAGRTINVACGSSISLLDLVDRINAILGTKIEPAFDAPRAGDVRHSLADIALARELLGYEPTVDFDGGLRRTIDWLRGRA
jgi:nucleoside-diphosphate-sugar epimerase